jgi:glycosyltransferase involved in cell wall biosynthesis
MSISVLILTKNEAANLPRCLESVAWSDDVVVLDSGSTDETVRIATDFGARVFHRDFDDEASQRTYSLKLPFKHDWVYNPDADEVASVDLRTEMLAVASAAGREEVAYQCRFRNMFMGRWLRYSSLYPTWVIRLFRPSSIRFERETNLRYVAAGAVGSLDAHFEHHSFNNGIEAWFEKHNRYSSGEARESLQSLANSRVAWRSLLDFRPSHARERRRALKELSFRMPMRPLLRFLYMYLWRGGIFDGIPGFHYCAMVGVYEYMIVLKMLEQRRRAAGKPL